MLKKWRGAARCPFCSQNAQGETVLVRCAQQRAALATPLKRGKRSRKTLAAALLGTRRVPASQGWAGVRSLVFLTILRESAPVEALD